MLSVDGGYLTFKLAFGGFDSWMMKYGQQVSMFAIDSKPKDVSCIQHINKIVILVMTNKQ